jgi:hypothetical protein
MDCRVKPGNDECRASASHRALAAHTFQLRFSLLITGRKQWSGSDHTRRLVLHTTQQRVAALPCASLAVPDQRCHSASKTRVNALMTSLALALHRVRDTRYGRPGFLIPISRCQTALLNAAPRGAAPQVLASACSAVGSQDDAASSMNCGSISGCAGAMSVRMIVPSLRLKNSSGFQTPPFQAMVTRSR